MIQFEHIFQMGSTFGSDSYTKHLAFSIDSAIHLIWGRFRNTKIPWTVLGELCKRKSIRRRWWFRGPRPYGQCLCQSCASTLVAPWQYPLTFFGLLVGWLGVWWLLWWWWWFLVLALRFFMVRQKMAAVPPILVLNYTLPSNPQQVKQEVEARDGRTVPEWQWVLVPPYWKIEKNREWCREKRETIYTHILINSVHTHMYQE